MEKSLMGFLFASIFIGIIYQINDMSTRLELFYTDRIAFIIRLYLHLSVKLFLKIGGGDTQSYWIWIIFKHIYLTRTWD